MERWCAALGRWWGLGRHVVRPAAHKRRRLFGLGKARLQSLISPTGIWPRGCLTAPIDPFGPERLFLPRS